MEVRLVTASRSVWLIGEETFASPVAEHHFRELNFSKKRNQAAIRTFQ